MSRKRKGLGNQHCQLSLFATGGNAVPGSREGGGTTEPDTGKSTFLSRLSENRALSVNLLDRVLDPTNLNAAVLQVVRNAGGAGVDGMKTTQLISWMRTNGQAWRTEILEGVYQPQPVRTVRIPKPNGGERMLGIPTVIDRVLQQAVAQCMTRMYDPLFSESSFGFRPGRSAQQAIDQASTYVRQGKVWVVDIDLKSFFDTIGHDRLMQRLSKGIGDKRVLVLIARYLKAGAMEGGLVQQRATGTPQGGPLSPLLSNIVLDEWDKELEKRGHSFVRYADDCNIYVGSRKAAERVYASMVRFIEGTLKLQVNRDKSGIGKCDEVNFLGFTLLPDGGVRVSDKSLKRHKKRVRQIVKRNRGIRFKQLLHELNVYLNGWMSYFSKANKWLDWKRYDRWLRRKLRCYALKQCGKNQAILRLLRRLGVTGKAELYAAKRSNAGWWVQAHRRGIEQGMSILWFARQGLRGYEALYKRFH